MKKILIAVDHKWRDLPGYVFLARLLESQGAKVFFCRNGLERFFVELYRPNAIIVNQILHK